MNPRIQSEFPEKLWQKISGKVMITAFLMLGELMVSTNPNKNAYVDYVALNLVTDVKSAICRNPKLTHWLSIPNTVLGETCETIFNVTDAIGSESLKRYISAATQRQNFVVFSIYTLDLPGRKFTTLGALGNFRTF